MFNTILFDLDGTLLQISQDVFVKTYFSELSKVFVKLGMDAEASVKAVWAGTKAMFMNDGSKTNAERFWETFSGCTGITGDELKAVEARCDAFYMNEFDSLKSLLVPNDLPKRIVHGMKAKGYTVVLATNPLFPECATETRLNWLGLKPEDFTLITHYGNCTFCKPHPGYYKELLAKLGKTPGECLMVGNNPVEDMSAAELGMEAYLVTDFLENETDADITAFKRGTLKDLEEYLTAV